MRLKKFPKHPEEKLGITIEDQKSSQDPEREPLVGAVPPDDSGSDDTPILEAEMSSSSSSCCLKLFSWLAFYVWMILHTAYFSLGILGLANSLDWLADFNFEFATYTAHLQTDDGLYLYPNGRIDAWYIGFALFGTGITGIIIGVARMMDYAQRRTPVQFWIPIGTMYIFAACTSSIVLWIQFETRGSSSYTSASVALLCLIYGEMYLRLARSMQHQRKSMRRYESDEIPGWHLLHDPEKGEYFFLQESDEQTMLKVPRDYCKKFDVRLGKNYKVDRKHAKFDQVLWKKPEFKDRALHDSYNVDSDTDDELGFHKPAKPPGLAKVSSELLAAQAQKTMHERMTEMESSLKKIEKRMGGYPHNAYALVFVLFHFWTYLRGSERMYPGFAYVKHMFLPFMCLLLTLFTQGMFIYFTYSSTGPLCVCVNTGLVSPLLAWGAVAIYVISVYLDVLESYTMIEFQLLVNTRPHVDSAKGFWPKIFSYLCLTILAGFFAVKLSMAVLLIIIAAPFLFSSANTNELILNAVSLLFILEIDELLYKYAVQADSILALYMDSFFEANPFPAKTKHDNDRVIFVATKLFRIMGFVVLFMFSIFSVTESCQLLFFHSVDYIKEFETFSDNHAPACLGLDESDFAN